MDHTTDLDVTAPQVPTRPERASPGPGRPSPSNGGRKSSPRPSLPPSSDPDADEAELFYPGFYTDAPDASAWVDQPVAWGEARVLGPEDDLVTIETYAAGDAALADLDPIDARLVTLVDIEGAPLSRAALELDLFSGEARERLARTRFAVRAARDRHFRS